ncbi:MAG: adenylate kinase [Candidatus Woesearchaeota archaeon]|nr:adenylate kinase [Candidatus Woesearchaeota archaeon]MDN5327775.1 adenylate kinase [Candidatus Woesearchaeota archaeon]
MVNLRLIITGTPGTGKSTLAEYLSKKLKLPLYNLTELIKQNTQLEKEYNPELETLEIDEAELKKFLNEFFRDKTSFILEGHLSHLISTNLVDLCIVLRTENKVLFKRLKSRGYSNNKIKDNLEAEIFNQCYEEAKLNKHKLLTVDTTFFNFEENTKDLDLLTDFLKQVGLIK